MAASGNKLKQATPKRRHDSASQSLLKPIVLGLEDYCLGAIAAPGDVTRQAGRDERAIRVIGQNRMAEQSGKGGRVTVMAP